MTIFLAENVREQAQEATKGDNRFLQAKSDLETASPDLTDNKRQCSDHSNILIAVNYTIMRLFHD